MNKKDKSILYIDCFSGISGDMFIGAALDMNEKKLSIDILSEELKKINIGGYKITSSKEKRGVFYGTRFNVDIDEEQPPRNFSSIKKIIKDSSLKEDVKDLSLEIFTEIARAESLVHSKPRDEIHFHEVGAIDSIIDIVCTALVIDLLNIGIVYGSRVPLGRGKVKTMHGVIPVPAPATLEILKEVPVYGGGFDFEVTTPTGAAIIKVLAGHYGDIPDILIDGIGLGIGSRNYKSKTQLPDVLRIIKGKIPDLPGNKMFEDTGPLKDTANKTLLLSTNIDDSTPEVAGYILNKLLKSGSHDAWLEPVYMKKNRPSFKLNVLCSREKFGDVLKIIFTESSTLGIRVQEIARFFLKREIKKIKLPYGEVDIKIGIMNGKRVTISPEYDSCVNLAQKTGKPFKEIYRDAVFFFQENNS
jgi:uncharacterized protein (TIGR00299 family) protein